MDYAALAEHVKVAIRFMDNVVDATGYYFDENRKNQMGIRRTGLGTMGLGDALIMMGLRYGSSEAVPTVEKIYKTIRDAAYESSADLAREKGVFPNYDKEKYLQGWFIKRLPREIKEKIAKNGIRNAVLLTQAPTGATSLLTGVSSGIEPVYDFAMVRRDRIGEHIIYHTLYQNWQDEHPGENHPDYFVNANDLAPEEHVKVQAIVQEYTDASISKTVNAPNNHSVEDVKKLYNLAYDLGCKGLTYMRDGSREGVLSHIESDKKQTEKAASNINGNGETSRVDETNVVYLRRRSDNLQGVTREMPTPVGSAFITINEDGHGNPFEVFINVGRAGSDIKADAEAIGRLISLALRIPSEYPQIEVVQKIVDQLLGIGGASQLGFGSNRVYSMADAVAKVLKDYLEQKREGKEVQSEEANGDGKSRVENVKETSQKEEEVKEPVAEQQPMLFKSTQLRRDICPKCGVASFIFEEGCKKCYSCGHSEC